MDLRDIRSIKNRRLIREIDLAIRIIKRHYKVVYAIEILMEEQKVLFDEGQDNSERGEDYKISRKTFEDVTEIKKAREDLKLALECISKYPSKARALSLARRILMKENERLEKEEILYSVNNDDSNTQDENSINDRLLDEIIRLSKRNGRLEKRIEYLENMLRDINNDEKRDDIFKRRV